MSKALDNLLSSIGWQVARREEGVTYYTCEESMKGYQPVVKIEDGDYSLEQIVSFIAFQAYVEGFKAGGDCAVKESLEIIREALH